MDSTDSYKLNSSHTFSGIYNANVKEMSKSAVTNTVIIKNGTQEIKYFITNKTVIQFLISLD